MHTVYMQYEENPTGKKGLKIVDLICGPFSISYKKRNEYKKLKTNFF